MSSDTKQLPKTKELIVNPTPIENISKSINTTDIERASLSDIETTGDFEIKKDTSKKYPIPVTITLKTMNNGETDVRGLKTTVIFSCEEFNYNIRSNGFTSELFKRNFSLNNVTVPIGNLKSGEVKETTHEAVVECPESVENQLLEEYRAKNHYNSLGEFEIRYPIWGINMTIGNSSIIND